MNPDIFAAFDSILERHPDPAWIYEPKSRRLLKVNAALAALTGYTREELMARTMDDLAPGGLAKEVLMLRCRGGRTVALRATASAVEAQPGPCTLVVGRPAGEAAPPAPSRETAARTRDRGTLADAVRTRLSRHRTFALLLVDLDRVKALNRTLGPEGVTLLVSAVEERLKSILQTDETLIRVEGGRFAMLLEGVQNSEAALHMAREVQGELEAPFTPTGQDIHVSASIGAALSHPDITDPAELVRNAEYALDDAKAQGIRGRRVFLPEMRAREAKDLRMEKDLRPGIERGDLRAYYQPIVNVRTGRLAGFEALARWHHPELGLLMPAQFIPMAESTGIIVDLGKRMMLDACRQVCEWQTRFRSDPPLYVTVNCSATQFVDPKFTTIVQWALVNSGLPPGSLKLELTETVLMDDDSETLRAVDRVLELGVKLIIDDFGTGYSSLSRLHQLPIESLKIDRSFVMGLVDLLDSQTMTRVIIQMARHFELLVTAEGIETEDQLRILRGLDCDFGQGYLFAKALEPSKAEELLSTSKTW
jgi:diguanylate cyclase (GGDEF)-like protein